MIGRVKKARRRSYIFVRSKQKIQDALLCDNGAHEGASSGSIAGIGGYYEKSDIIVSGAVYDGYDWL